LEDASRAYSTMPEKTVVGIYSKWLGADTGTMSKIYASKTVDPRMVPLKPAAQAFWTVNRAALLQEKSIGSQVTLNQLFDFSFSS
jgi:hypothetical protein